VLCAVLSSACTTTANDEVGASAVAGDDDLAQLTVDDRPEPVGVYRREDWPHWDDVDGDGCDAREQALIAQSTSRAQVDPFGCKVVAGDWVSLYDGAATSNPGELDVDHVVSLEDAFASGGWRWTVEQRRAFANDQRNLLVVSASSNRAKGSSTADEWRPPRRDAWCRTAMRVAQVKAEYDLTVTTEERDALGQMLATC
jgi:hypothetical protein